MINAYVLDENVEPFFQYLLQGIVANRQKTSLSDRELQNLLSDFKPHRSKWVSFFFK